MSLRKVFVLGLDGATYDLLKPWADEGVLPNMGRLLAEGAWGELRSTIPPMTGPAWTSFMTGKNPGKHGIYDWIYRHPDAYDVSPLTAQHCKQPTLWSLLSRAGRKVCTLNVPMTFPPETVNGVQISGIPAPSTQITISYPPQLLSEIQRDVGEYLLYPDPGSAYSDSGVDSFLDRLYRTTERRLEVLDYLRQKDDWDFTMMVLSGTDTVQHAMWKYMSPDHPLHDPDKAGKYGSAIRDYFVVVDEAIGQMVASLDKDTTFIIMSDHGFGPFHKFIHVNNWLRKQGWLVLKPSLPSLFKAALFDLGLSPMQVYDGLMQIGLGKLKREVVRGKGQGMMRSLFLSFDDVDWSRTRAYSLGNVGQVFLNVRGREPQGIVQPGTEYERIRADIISELGELRDPENGELVVEQIFRREDVYQGPELEKGADIVFLPTRMEYFGFGEYEFGSHQIIESMRRGISGTHRMNGTLLIHGESVKSGAQISGASLVDLAPTILHLMGESVPEDMDGQVLFSALQGELGDPALMRRMSGTDQGDGKNPTTTLAPEDEQALVERLRSLGYVG
jgi:predicted AlkP superfamily phosphohydrolase/phosphomutase